MGSEITDTLGGVIVGEPELVREDPVLGKIWRVQICLQCLPGTPCKRHRRAAKPISRECPCGIVRADCDYHRA